MKIALETTSKALKRLASSSFRDIKINHLLSECVELFLHFSASFHALERTWPLVPVSTASTLTLRFIERLQWSSLAARESASVVHIWPICSFSEYILCVISFPTAKHKSTRRTFKRLRFRGYNYRWDYWEWMRLEAYAWVCGLISVATMSCIENLLQLWQ